MQEGRKEKKAKKESWIIKKKKVLLEKNDNVLYKT